MVAKIEPVTFSRSRSMVDFGKVNVATAKMTRPINERLMYDSERRRLYVLGGLFKIRIAPVNF